MDFYAVSVRPKFVGYPTAYKTAAEAVASWEVEGVAPGSKFYVARVSINPTTKAWMFQDISEHQAPTPAPIVATSNSSPQLE